MHHRSRLAFKPGLTGMWQVSGRSNITDFEEVVRLDTEYIKKWNPGLDIKILFKTVAVVLGKVGSKQNCCKRSIKSIRNAEKATSFKYVECRNEAAVKAMVDELLIKYPGAKITISNNGFTPYPGMPENIIQIDRFPKLESRMAQLEFFIVLLFKGKFAFTKEARKFIRALKEADVVLHAPGGPSIGDTYFKAEKLYLWRLNLIRRMGIPYIFYAPSMGPFNCTSAVQLMR